MLLRQYFVDGVFFLQIVSVRALSSPVRCMHISIKLVRYFTADGCPPFQLLYRKDLLMESVINIYFYNEVSKFEDFPTTNYRSVWDNKLFEDPYVRFVLENVDKCVWVDNDVVCSPVLGTVPMERLSGAFKTLVMAYLYKDKKFPLVNLGDNCKEAIYRGALNGATSWNYEGYMPELLAEQICYFPEIDTKVTGNKVKSWLINDCPTEYNPVDRRRRRYEELKRRGVDI